MMYKSIAYPLEDRAKNVKTGSWHFYS